MNKKFSTLVATLLLSGALFTLNAAPVQVEDGLLNKTEISVNGKNYTFTQDIKLEANDYWLIDEEGITIDGAKHKFTGRIVVKAENVTIKNLNIVLKNATSNYSYYKNAITVVAGSVKIENNNIDCSVKKVEGVEALMANGISIFPTKADGKYVVSGNTISNANAIGQGNYESAALMVSEGLTSFDLDGDTGSDVVTTANLEDFDITSVGTNTFNNCGIDYSYATWSSGDQLNKQYRVTPRYNKKGVLLNQQAVTEAVTKSNKDSKVDFRGTIAQLEAALGYPTSNITTKFELTTSDGLVITGLKRLDAEVKIEGDKFDFVSNPSANEYYRLFLKSNNSGHMYLVTIDETTKKPSLKDVNNGDASESDLTDNSLFKMEVKKQGHADNFTFTFVSKSGLPLLTGKNNENTFIESEYDYTDNGAIFNLDNLSLTDESNTNYFGLYKAGLHTLTAGELSQIEGGGFSITIEPKDLVGNPFAGRLTPMWWDKTNKSFSKLGEAAGNTEYYLKNADDNYIVAKLFGAEGGNKNQAFYVFTTVTEEALKADLAKADDKRTLFGQFMMYYKPTSADDDMLEIKSIESMKVEVLNNNNRLAYAPVGYANISTTDQTEKTLTASLKSTQYPITIKVGNNIVDPTAFLKKAFYTVTKIDEKEGNTILAVTSCDVKVDPKFVESVGNDLEAQWAITYDEKAATYTFKNREQVGTEWVVNVNALREDDNTKDDIYVIGGDSYQIATVADAKESDGYLWLGDVENQRYAMGYYVKALEEGEYLWFVGDKEGNISFEKSNDASVATEMKFVDAIKDDKIVVDTVKVVSKITYYDATKKDFATADSVLKVPVYAFTNVDGKNFGYNGKQYVFGAKNADSLTIRVDNGQYNLRLATKSTDGKAIFANDKIYAGASADYLDKTNCVYDDTKNDLFTVAALNRPEYRRLGATVENDGLKDMDVNTVKINRSNDENTYLYENSANRNANNGDPILNFLGETNLADQPENASLAIFVDTAYVRNETTEPLYLLSVRNSFVEGQEAVPCPDHGFDPDCPHWTPATPDHRVGAYLVGLADSTETVEQAMYQGNVRLAFVDATHVGDSLIIDNSKFSGDKKLAKNDTLSFVNANGTQRENVATFSFRLVDPASTEGDFYIETAPNTEGKVQYVRIHNSVPVLVDKLEEAATFNIAQTDEQATDNEEITASEVKVIAGAGQITINGAAGKKVVVSNILGQVVANTVITSDNATIAAPQGIVVVAVEGEEAVKAIVK